ncbi:hypothetical protein VUR80DRAFT_5402 [Thermomyces stellatus]
MRLLRAHHVALGCQPIALSRRTFTEQIPVTNLTRRTSSEQYISSSRCASSLPVARPTASAEDFELIYCHAPTSGVSKRSVPPLGTSSSGESVVVNAAGWKGFAESRGRYSRDPPLSYRKSQRARNLRLCSPLLATTPWPPRPHPLNYTRPSR